MITVYGIPPDVYQCWGCHAAMKLIAASGRDHQFIPVMVKSDNDVGFVYDRPRFDEARKLARKPTGPLTMPVIAVDGVYIGGYQELKSILDD